MAETKMVEKSSKPRRAAPKPGSAKGSVQSDKQVSERPQTERKPETRRKRLTLQERIMEHLAEIPALLAVSTLSQMLRDTGDGPTRLAIQRARIDVLRARTIACRLGKPADSTITLAALLNRNANVDVAPVETPVPPKEEEQTAQPAAEAPLPPADAQQDMRIELTEAHIHQGVQLPKGAKLVVNAVIGANLIEMEVAKPVIEDAPDEDASELDTDPTEIEQDDDKTDDLDGQNTASS
ncbi:MAG: hypothetical protein IKE14_06685 [Loktanella sp.]|nr:hypothetical protein [Loktanella sp.]